MSDFHLSPCQQKKGFKDCSWTSINAKYIPPERATAPLMFPLFYLKVLHFKSTGLMQRCDDRQSHTTETLNLCYYFVFFMLSNACLFQRMLKLGFFLNLFIFKYVLNLIMGLELHEITPAQLVIIMLWPCISYDKNEKSLLWSPKRNYEKKKSGSRCCCWTSGNLIENKREMLRFCWSKFSNNWRSVWSFCKTICVSGAK